MDNPNSLLSIADIAQIGITILNFSAYPMQWKTIFKRKSSADISLSSWSIWLCSCILAQFYGWANFLTHGHNYMLIVTESVSLVCVIATISMIVFYRQNKTSDALSVRPHQHGTGLCNDYIFDDYQPVIEHVSFEEVEVPQHSETNSPSAIN